MDFLEHEVIPSQRRAARYSRAGSRPAPETLRELHATARLLKAAGNPVRIKILYLLGYPRKLNVTQLSEALQVTVATASRHISVLRRHGLLEPRHQGAAVYYRLTEDPFHEVLRASLFTVGTDDARGGGE